MNQVIRYVWLASVMVLVFAAPSFAQQGGTALITFSNPISAAVIIIGAGFGIGKIGAAAVDAMARQPEVAGSIQTAMIIAAALIEGATFTALGVCFAK